MTVTQAAEYLQVSRRTIFRLIERKLIEAEKMDFLWIIKKDSLEAYKGKIKGKAKNDPTRGKD